MSADVTPHSAVRQVVNPTTVELVIDGAVYSVDGIKQLIAQSLMNVQPAPSVEPELDPISRRAREVADFVAERKEEILQAFVAKYGFQPDECEVVSTHLAWFVRKRDTHREQFANAFRRLRDFVSSEEMQKALPRRMACATGTEAVFNHIAGYLTELALLKVHKPDRVERTAAVKTHLIELGAGNLVPVVETFLAYDAARKAACESLSPPSYMPQGLPIDDEEGDDS